MERVGADYEGWLPRQPLSAKTKRTYRVRASQYLEYLSAAPAEYGDPISERHARDYAVRDYKTYLKTVRRAKPSSANLSLAGIDNFCRFLGLGKPGVRREEPPGAAPRSLSPEEQKRLLRAHVNVLGRYEFCPNESVASGRLRPLRDPAEIDEYEFSTPPPDEPIL